MYGFGCVSFHPFTVRYEAWRLPLLARQIANGKSHAQVLSKVASAAGPRSASATSAAGPHVSPGRRTRARGLQPAPAVSQYSASTSPSRPVASVTAPAPALRTSGGSHASPGRRSADLTAVPSLQTAVVTPSAPSWTCGALTAPARLTGSGGNHAPPGPGAAEASRATNDSAATDTVHLAGSVRPSSWARRAQVNPGRPWRSEIREPTPNIRVVHRLSRLRGRT